MEFSVCPICNLTVMAPELERHANEHFAEEDSATDFELAQQIALIPSIPWETLQSSYLQFDARRNSTDEKHSSLVRSQSEERYYKVEESLMTLLKKCLELESDNSTTILAGYVDHFYSTKSEDYGWGCGWRNIQMLSSHLLKQREEASEVLYGGSGFVPDIPSLQRWLEYAWEKGFDTPGSHDFDQKIYGKKNWIGTTECATLFRSFGLRARIVDFCCKDIELDPSASHSSLGIGKTDKKADKRRNSQVSGPMDIFLSKGKLDSSSAVPSGSDSHRHSSVSPESGHYVLIDWVWRYFSDSNVNMASNRGVLLSKKAPLYFQHDGHSRTIIGIQSKCQRNGLQQYNLLVFDPAEKTRTLEKSLRDNNGWQKLIKRGPHTLKKLQYQLCFIDPGIACGDELEQLKTLHSIRHEF